MSKQKKITIIRICLECKRIAKCDDFIHMTQDVFKCPRCLSMYTEIHEIKSN